ncbi:HlyD family secretion protein [Paenirhodobacter sp.]|uniref:HlyD family secretion protein n=1 Tax=Paenirhodobacter sp. TaxID=1965326 RepID=UPI003B3FA1E3
MPQDPQSPSGAPAARRKAVLGGIAVLLLVAGIWFGYRYWTEGRFMVETDDAYVQADFAVLAPRVSGYVAAVPAVENRAVKAGDPLVMIRDADYRDALAQAEAQLAAQTAALARIAAQTQAAETAVTQAEARRAAAAALRDQAGADLTRYAQLARHDAASEQRLEAARAGAATAEAALHEAEAGIAAARAAVTVSTAQKAEAEAEIPGLRAARDLAARSLDDTVIRAPVDGVVGNLSVATGDYVTAGRRLLAVIPLGQVYIEANYKETQVGALTPGMKVHVEVDAYPDRGFTGEVEGVSPASGSVFSLLPPENATGNFTKVVQRLPVRIAVPAEVAGQGWLRPGMSVIVRADSRTVAGG